MVLDCPGRTFVVSGTYDHVSMCHSPSLSKTRHRAVSTVAGRQQEAGKTDDTTVRDKEQKPALACISDPFLCRPFAPPTSCGIGAFALVLKQSPSTPLLDNDNIWTRSACHVCRAVPRRVIEGDGKEKRAGVTSRIIAWCKGSAQISNARLHK